MATASDSYPSDSDNPNPQKPVLPSSPSTDADLDDIVGGFRDIQSTLHYQRAQDVLRNIVDRLDLTARERQGLEVDLQSLNFLLDKLDQSVVNIAAFGMVGRGKSSLLNALLGRAVFETGPLHGVTQDVQTVDWTVEEERVQGSDRPVVRVSLPGTGASRIELVDTPGLDEVDGEQREAIAQRVAQQADLILFVVSGDVTRLEYEALSNLRDASKPMVLVFNKIDQYPDADRMAIYHKIRDERVRDLLSPDEIVMASAAPLIATAIRRADGTMTRQLQPGEPQIDDLKLKILEILHREGKSLLALNSMLFADAVNDRLVERKLKIRDRNANQVVWNGVMTKAVAIALNPLMVVDVVSSAVIDVAMILALSRLYSIPMTQHGATGLLKTIAVGLGGITLSELLVTLGLGSLKTALGLATPATGGISLAPYVSVAVTQAAVAGVSTYAIGQVAKVYLANGASWGPDGPKTVVNTILESLDETSILNRIKDELRAKLDLQRRRQAQSSVEK
ncbi:MAG: GTP-binding protein [Cyanobacteria bacterium J06638_20]